MLIYTDDAVAVAIKPPRVLSTDEPGGMPELVRQALGNESADVRTVHRLGRRSRHRSFLTRFGKGNLRRNI